jgi:riboflavin kinase/FMN adenylyltransferase
MIVRDFHKLIGPQATAVTLGTFDGLHRGHQELLDRVKKLAKEKGLRSLVLTFSQPPRNYINGKPKKKLILPLAKKLELLAEYGIDDVVVVGFQEICAMSPSEFAKLILKDQFRAAEVVVGYDCRFGKNRAGDTETLKALGSGFGFGVTIVEPVVVEGVVVSSTEVRQAIQMGDVERAAKLLSYCPFICGRIIQGEGSGWRFGSSRTLLAVDENLVTPDEGIFMVKAGFLEREEPGVMSIALDPHSPDHSPSVEVHLLTPRLAERDGVNLEVKLLKKLRREGECPSWHSLRHQIRADRELVSQWPNRPVVG